MTNVVKFPRSPMERLGLITQDADDAAEVEDMVAEAFGGGDTDEYLLPLALMLIAQLRRRVTALEERLQQKEG